MNYTESKSQFELGAITENKSQFELGAITDTIFIVLQARIFCTTQKLFES
jgi:hypothetical protein